MIFVTVGTHEQQFNRLVEYMDKWAAEHDEKVVIQTGFSTYQPKHCEWSKLFPYKRMDTIFKAYKIVKLALNMANFIRDIISLNLWSALTTIYEIIDDWESIKEDYAFILQDSYLEEHIYSQIGGLYMIEDETNTVYQCDNFFNEKRDHFICKNHNIKSLLSIISDFHHYRNYLTLDQDIMS